jgi:hypothetical protein
MVAPVAEWTAQTSPLLAVTLFYLGTLLVLPVLLVALAATLSRWWGGLKEWWVETATHYSYALIPLGFGMWLAHYGFHFLTSYDTVIPTTQRFAGDLGLNVLGAPIWVASCCRPAAEWLPRLEILFLDVGLLMSLYSAYRIALAQTGRPLEALKVVTPWVLLLVLLFAVGIWIVFQPMQMRGTLPG